MKLNYNETLSVFLTRFQKSLASTFNVYAVGISRRKTKILNSWINENVKLSFLQYLQKKSKIFLIDFLWFYIEMLPPSMYSIDNVYLKINICCDENTQFSKVVWKINIYRSFYNRILSYSIRLVFYMIRYSLLYSIFWDKS